MIKTSYILVAVAIFLLVMIPNVSSAEWDNVKSYEAVSKTVTIKDSFLGIPIGDVATVKLLSPTPIYVNTGWQQIADMEVDNTKEERTMNDILGAITFKDLKSGKIVTREMQYKVFEKNGTRTITEYEANCYPEKGESCDIINTYYEDTGNWVTINADKKIKKEQARIGIFVNVQKDDYVDYIPTLYGVSIDEWAVYINLVVNAHGVAPSTTTGTSDPEGMQIIANKAKSLAAIKIYDSDVDAPYCYVGHQSLGCGNGYLTPLGNFTVNLVTRYANITAGVVNLTAGNCYVVTCGNGSTGSYTRSYNTAAMPINTTDIEFRSRAYQLNNMSYWDNGGGADAQFNIKELITAELATSSVTLVAPADTSVVGYKNVTFNCFANFTSGITNVTLWIDQVANLSAYNTTVSENVSLTTNQNVSLGSHNWTCSAVDFSASQKFATNYSFTRAAITENSRSFNATSYETLVEGYYLNLSSDGVSVMTADLWFNGTKYSTTKVGNDSNAVFNASITQPLNIFGNKSFFWSMIYGTDNVNSSLSNQTVYPILLNLCNATLNVPYINFTFKDEVSLANINATLSSSLWYYWLNTATVNKSLVYTNATENPSYAFCFSPASYNLYNTRYLPYASTGYPQRVYSSSTLLTNGTNNQTLYLLGSGDGIYVTFQTTSSAGVIVTGVNILVERQIGGNWTTLEEATTDDAGIATFWLNPSIDHRFTFTKTGCTTTTTNLKPTQSSYTQPLVCGGANTTTPQYTLTIDGLTFLRNPPSGVTAPGNTNFTFYTYTTKNNVYKLLLNIVNQSGNVVASSQTNCTNLTKCTTSLMYYANNSMDLKGRYYVDINDSTGYILIEGDAHWRFIQSNVSDYGTVKDFILNLKYMFNVWGNNEDNFACSAYYTNASCSADTSCKWIRDGLEYCIPIDNVNKTEFSKFVLIFLFLAIVLAMVNKLTGIDNANPGLLAVFAGILVIVGSVAGGMNCLNQGCQGLFYYDGVFGGSSNAALSYAAGFLNNYILAIICGFFMVGYIFNNLRRNS